MTAETDLLPLPAYDIDTVNHASVRLRGYTGDRTRAYAHACVSSATEALRAEVERLQGEVDDLGEQLVDDAARANDERSYWYIVKATKAQNERLAEALRDAAQHLRDHAGNEFQQDFEDNSEAARLNRLNLLADRIAALANAAQPGGE